MIKEERIIKNTGKALEGFFTLEDGTINHFSIDLAYGWNQWGSNRLKDTAYRVEELHKLFLEGLI